MARSSTTTAVASALVLLLASCGGRQAPSQSPDRAREAPAAAEPDAEGEREAQPPPYEAAPAPASVQKSRAAPGDEDAAEEESRAPDAAAGATADASGVEQRASRMQQEHRAFVRSLEPTTLSCDGARRHERAICDIAEQICDISRDSPGLSSAQSRCVEGRRLCKQAGAKLRERCQ